MEKKFQTASAKIDQKSLVSDTLKKRAQDLKDTASRLFANVSNKMKLIQGKLGFSPRNIHPLTILSPFHAQSSSTLLRRMAKNWRICSARWTN